MKITRLLLFEILVATMVIFISCRKTDQNPVDQEKPITQTAATAKFFTIPAGTNAIVKAIAQIISKQNAKKEFVNGLTKRIGYPLWDKAMIATSKGIAHRGATGDSSTIIYIPFAIPDSNTTAAVLAVRQLPSDTLFSLCYPQHYQQFGFDTTIAGWNARNVFQMFAEFDYTIFGHTDFLVTDGRIFGQAAVDTLLVKRKPGLGGRGTYQQRQSDWIELCVTYIYEVQLHGFRSSVTVTEPPIELEICTTYWNEAGMFGGGGSGPGNGGGGNGGGGGGGSTGGSWTLSYPCIGAQPRSKEDQVPCGSGWVWVPVGGIGSMINYLSSSLNLTSEQIIFLSENQTHQNQIYNYLIQSNSDELSKENSKEHIGNMMTDPLYLQFVNEHSISGDITKIWWLDDNWLSNPNNFSLDIDQTNNQYDELNAQEKLLVAAFPLAASRIKRNVLPALSEAQNRYPGTVLNGKGDAFRHAFFNALNTRDVLPRLIPPAVSASEIVRQFALAHESNVPVILQLFEIPMDLFNNEVGIDYCWNCFFTSNSAIANAIAQKLSDGELRYLSPLDYILSPEYDANHDHIQDCPTCLNGIIPSTIMKKTNE